ncbi:hypothetical protein [Myxococcus sp. RHSTA-1-4]|uniref:hypothetical protein n=1 Tax=Myxococcus sp. RHSTA-1-4 TaxID=2874601 RepID=UPI00351CD37D|nr:hypothetical protein [Myxococcus sp. RHSTA-1-4]
MRFRTFLPLILVLCTCRGPAPREAPPAEATRTHVWVDPAGWKPGDGTRERPLRSLAEALARPGPLTVHVALGTYTGPFTLPAGVRVEGQGPGSVLYVEGPDAPVLRAGRDTALADLAVLGGAWGLEVTGGGRVRVERVGFSGQRTGAVRVEAGRLEVEDARFEASVSETTGVLLEGAAVEARITGSVFTGPFRRAVRVRGAGVRVEVEDARFLGPVSAVGVDGGHAEVRRATAEGGRGSAFSVVEGALVLEEVRVTGHEYGVSAMQARRLDVRGFTSVRAERAGLGVVRSRGVLEDVVVQGSGEFGGIQQVGGELEVRRFRVEGAAEYGLVATQGRLRVRDGTITRVRSGDGIAGDGLHLRQVEADVEGVVVDGVAGTCVLAAQDARVVLRDAELSGCGHAGLMVDTLARLEATGVEVRGGGTALAAMGDGEVRADALTASGLSEGLVWAECQGSTRVRLSRVRSEDVRGLSAPCVER